MTVRIRSAAFIGVNVVLLAHFMALLLMVAAGGSGAFSSPPLIVRLASITAPYARFTGMQNAYRFFAPDPGPATILWARLCYEDGGIRWIEVPGRDTHPQTLAYQREFYPAMMLGMQTAPPETAVIAGYPHLTDIGLTYASSYARHLATTWMRPREGGTIPTVEILVMTHAIRTPAQVRQGWPADDLRLYQATDLGVFQQDGTLADKASKLGHQKPLILEVAARMLRDAVASRSGAADPDFPQPLRSLLTRFPELRDPTDTRPLQMRIGFAVASRDLPSVETQPELPP